jgi:hypothetical protein
MVMEAVFAVVVLGLLGVLAVRGERLRARVRRLESNGAAESRNVAAVQGWAAQEFRAIRGEFTVARVNASAAEVMARRTQKRAVAAGPALALDDDPEEQRDTVAMSPPSGPVLTPVDEDGDATNVLDPEPPMYARHATMCPSALLEPLAHPDLIGSEDIADEVASMRLGPDEVTPPRRGRAAVLVPAFSRPEEGGAA